MKPGNRSIVSTALLVALALTALVYAPMFAGRIPLPAVYIFDFPPFAKAAPPEPAGPHANIGDLVTSFYPYRTLAARAIREGAIPLWNPYILSGAPFLASAQSALFYPPNFLYYILPVPVAWSIGFIVRRLLAAVFMAMFVRKIGGSATASIVSALLFSFCGFLTAWQGQAMSDAAIWLPLICYSVVRLRSEPSAPAVAVAALAFAMPVLAGHPETAAHLMLTGLGLAAFLAIGPFPGEAGDEWRQSSLRFLKYLVATGLLALGLAAVQIIPTVEWLKYIHHSLKDPWPPPPLWSVLGFVSRDTIRATNSAGLLMPEHAAYLAMLTFVAAPVAFLHSSRRFVIFFALWTAAALSAAFAIGPAHWLVQQIPVLSMLKNSRLILIAGFGLSVLAGLGISELENFKVSESWRRRFWAAFLAAAGGSLALTMIYVVHLLPMQMVEYVRLPKFGLFLLAASAAAIALKVLGALKGRQFQLLVLLIAALDVGTVSYGAIPFTRPRDVFPSVDLFDRLPKDSAAPFRIGQLGYAYGANFELMYGHSAVGGYEISLERIKTFLKDLSRDEMDSVMLTTKGVLETQDRRLDMLNTKYYIVSEWDRNHLDFRDQPERFRFLYTVGDTEVYENLRALPPAFLVAASGIEVIPDEAAQLNRMKDPAFDPERHVVLPQAFGDAGAPGPASTVQAAASKVEWVSRRANDFDLDVNAAVPSVLVVSQISYPGWKSYIDDHEAPVIRANYALPAVLIPPGPHRVRFSFEPLTFKIGLALSALAAGIIFLVVIGAKRQAVPVTASLFR